MAKAKTSKSSTAASSAPKKKAKAAAAAPAAAPAATSRGGARRGAGRPVGSGQYGCQTKAVRIPVHLVEDVKEYVKRKIKTEQRGTKKDKA